MVNWFQEIIDAIKAAIVAVQALKDDNTKLKANLAACQAGTVVNEAEIAELKEKVSELTAAVSEFQPSGN
jgi:hypothetical protein